MNLRVLGGEGFEGDAVAKGLELGDSPLTLAIGVASDEIVATKVLVVAVIAEQVPSDHQDRVPHDPGVRPGRTQRSGSLPCQRTTGPWRLEDQ